MTIAKELEKTASDTEAHVLRIMDQKEGDVKLMWDPDNDAEVASARNAFDDAKKRGMSAFKVDRKGNKATAIQSFDPDLSAIIMAPPVVGG